jgi:hypothetical protein
MLPLGGAMIVQKFPEHEKAGKMVLPPIVLPCVLDVAVIKSNTGSVLGKRQPTCDQGDSQSGSGSLAQSDIDCVKTTIAPIGIQNGEFGLYQLLSEIRWDIYLEAELLRIAFRSVRIVRLRIGSTDQSSWKCSSRSIESAYLTRTLPSGKSVASEW